MIPQTAFAIRQSFCKACANVTLCQRYDILSDRKRHFPLLPPFLRHYFMPHRYNTPHPLMRIIRKFHYQSYSPLGLDKILTLGNVNKFPFLSLNRIFALSLDKISGTSAIKMKVFWPFILYCTRFALSLDKISGTSAIKMKVFWPFILYCTRFALSLQAECRDG